MVGCELLEQWLENGDELDATGVLRKIKLYFKMSKPTNANLFLVDTLGHLFIKMTVPC